MHPAATFYILILLRKQILLGSLVACALREHLKIHGFRALTHMSGHDALGIVVAER